VGSTPASRCIVKEGDAGADATFGATETMSFHVVIVTPEQQVFDQTITQAILPAHDGEIGILTDRAPLLVKLGQGRLQLDLQGGQKRRLYVEGGIAQMKDNNLTVLTQMAVPVSEINAEPARTEFP